MQDQPGQFNQPFSVPTGVGSGVIYDNQGHILTNGHVVEGAQRLLVSLPDGRSFDGKLIGADAQTDVAVVQITGDNLPVAALGDAGTLQVGEWVVAIGNALSLSGGPTVTSGVVSALGRAIQEPSDTGTNAQGPFLFNVIQTDAPINPGNSGGPLANLSGQVIGLNTLVAGSDASSGVQAQGIGFAISINTAKEIADELIATGKAVHPYMGISYEPLTPSIAAHLNLSVENGALVLQVADGSPSASAGLQERDVILEVNGAPLTNDSDLAVAINSHKPGDTLDLTVLRGNDRQDIKVTLTTAP